MGAITGMLGLDGGASGTGFSAPQLPAVQQADPTGMNNLQNTYQQLQQVANGQGPNPAQAAYHQNVQNLAQQQAGAISSIQGISPALAARMISQQGSSAMQNAAAGGAKMQAEQQLGALGQQGSIGASQASNANQAIANAIGAQNNVNTTNAGLAQAQMGNQGQMIGGILQGGGMAMGMMAGGGEVGLGVAPGAAPGPQSQFARFLQGVGNNLNPQGAPTIPGSDDAPPASGSQALRKGASGFAQGFGKMLKGKPTGPMAGGAGDAAPAGLGFGAAPVMAAAGGGKVPALVSPGERFLKPKDVAQVARGKSPMEVGEKIPGKPMVAGNSYANDTVPKKLDVGGIVIPNSIMQSKNPANGARDFIADIIAKRKARK